MKNFFVKFRVKISELFNKNKKLFIFTIALIIVVVFCFIFYPTSSSKTNISKNSDVTLNSSNADYVSKLETKLEEMLMSMNEVTKANVMVMCDSTEIVEYLKNKNESYNESGSVSSSSEEVAYEKNGSNSSPIIVTTKMPKVVGVWVIINSVSASTKLAITNSIVSVLNVPESSISILQER